MVSKKLLSPFQNILLFNTLIKLSGIAKVSFILGSQIAFFSAVGIITPLSGAFAGVAGSLGVFGCGLLIRAVLFSSFPLYFLAYHIPGLFASLYWASNSKLARIVPALICMALFIAHPVGSQAAIYSLFWLIPVYVSFCCKDTIFTRALGSTFTAHAVGSVIWLLAVPMSADQWLMLIPVVIVERALFTIGMVAGYKVINYGLNTKLIKNKIFIPFVPKEAVGRFEGNERL